MLLYKKGVVWMSTVLLFVNVAAAQISFSSLQDVWNYADKYSIQVQTAEANKVNAGINVRQAKGAMLPTASLNGAFTDNVKIQSTLIPANLFNPAAPADTYTEAIFGRRYIYNGSINMLFEILNTQDWFAVKTAKLNSEIALLNIAKAKADLYEQLANVYFSCMLLSEAESLSQENLNVSAVVYTIAKEKFTEGLISEVTLNTALINKEKAEKSLNVATENKNLQLNNLKLLLNTADSILLTEKISDKPITTDTAQFAQDPNVQLSYVQMQYSKNQWKSAKAAFAPTLSAVYQYNTQIAADDFLKFNNSNTTPQQYWGLRLSVPIFTGNTKKYQVQKAKIDYDVKQKQYENAKLQSGIANQNMFISYNSSLNAFEKSKHILSLYQSNDAHAERRMKEGIISLDDRLKFYADLIISQNEYLQSMSDYYIEEYRLKIRQTNLVK
jgi:outer membrane protein